MTAAAEAEVLGVRIRRRSRVEVLGTLRAWLADEAARGVYFVHAATANLAFENPGYCSALNRGDLVLNDGAGVRWAARARGVELADNLVGTDLLPQLLVDWEGRALRVYLLGGRPGVAARAAERIRERYPDVEVAGCADGYFSGVEEPAVVQAIHRAAPDLLLVAMGNPRQELFIDRHLEQLGCRVAIAVGGLFDHLAGELRRAPPWVRRLDLEWLQLLAQQPHKWRRYLLGVPKFLWRVFCGRLARALRAVLAVAVSLAAAMTGAEGLTRAVRPQILERYPESLYVESASRQYRLRPGFQGVFRYPEFQTHVRISAQGLRENREYGPARQGVRRVLVVGDSFTMGYSVEEEQTWVRRLEHLLRARGPSGWEVINAGVPGYSTWQELSYLEEEGLKLSPQVVLLGFFVGNDVVDNARTRLPVELREGWLLPAQLEEGLLPIEFQLALARRSHLYHLAQPVQRAWRRPGSALPDRYGVYTGEAEAGWLATAFALKRLAGLRAQRGVRPIVVLIPEEAQVQAEPGRRLAERLGRAPGRFDPRLPNYRMRELCRGAGIEWLDLLDPLRGAGIYFPQDGHLTRDGNERAARAVGAYLAGERGDAPQ